MANVEFGEFSLERMCRAVENVRDRLLRAAAALEQSGIPYAVIGGNAVAAWVSRVDEAAVRNTADVDLLIRRADLDRVITALETVGFVYRRAAGIDMFLDGPLAKARDAVRVLFAGEKVRPEYAYPTTDVEPAEEAVGFRIVALDSLVRMKLTSFRRKDQVHLLDMLDLRLIDESWLTKLPADLAARLQELIDTPDG
jgi:hypothetical protein